MFPIPLCPMNTGHLRWGDHFFTAILGSCLKGVLLYTSSVSILIDGELTFSAIRLCLFFPLFLFKFHISKMHYGTCQFEGAIFFFRCKSQYIKRLLWKCIHKYQAVRLISGSKVLCFLTYVQFYNLYSTYISCN